MDERHVLLKKQKETAARQSHRDLPITTLTEFYESHDVSLGLDICLPNPAAFPGPRPGVVFFFGGGFMVGSRAAFGTQCEELARHGYAAVTADYRIAAIHGSGASESFEDGVLAWRYVQANAERWGMDPDRIALGGGSAGAMIALNVGKLSGVMPRALVLFNPGIFDPAAVDGTRIGSWYTGRIPPFGPEDLKRGMPPMLIQHGEEDTTVPLQPVRAFADRARELGIDARLVTYPGVGHGFFNFNRSRPHYFMTLGAAMLFLDEILENRV